MGDDFLVDIHVHCLAFECRVLERHSLSAILLHPHWRVFTTGQPWPVTLFVFRSHAHDGLVLWDSLSFFPPMPFRVV
jgi:hypothetical protein